MHGPEGAYWAGLQTCGSIHACPVCSAIIRTRRALMIEASARLWLSLGGRLLFLTLTTSHDRREALTDLYGPITAAWRSLQAHRWWREQSIFGFWRSTEITYGYSGWHPHLHVLLFVEGDWDLAEAGREIGGRWRLAAQRSGLSSPSLTRGARLQPVTATAGAADELARYLSKVLDDQGDGWGVGAELARADAKRSGMSLSGLRRGAKGLSPMDLLESAADGEALAVRRWHEYEQATKGRRAVEASRSVNRLCRDNGIQDKTDEELAVEQQDGDLVLTLSGAMYRAIALAGYAAEVLNVEETDGPVAALGFVQALLRVVAP